MIKESQYEQFLEIAVKELEGDWIIIGGSLLKVLRASNRSTVDIDLCSFGELTNESRLKLMEIAQKIGLPVEAINPSADFFLRQIPDWKNSVELLQAGKNCRLFRPSLSLYWKLKLRRGTPIDIDDCAKFLIWHRQKGYAIDSQELRNVIEPLSSELDLKKLKDLLS